MERLGDNTLNLCSMAIKINVTQRDREALTHALEMAGYKGQRRKFHCTVGFIEKMIPSQEATGFGEAITHELQEMVDRLRPLYEVDKAAHLFGHVLTFLPTPSSQKTLRDMNLWLYDKVREISGGRWNLNQESLSENYIPHLTLWHVRRPDRRLKKLEKFAETHPTYYLAEAAYVIFNPSLDKGTSQFH